MANVKNSKTSMLAARNEALLNMFKGLSTDEQAKLIATLSTPKTESKAVEAKPVKKEEKAAKVYDKSWAERMEENQAFVGKVVKLTKGKFKDHTCKIFFSSLNKFCLRGEYDNGLVDFASPRDCEIIGDMNAADLARLVGANEAGRQETIYVDATCVGEGEKAIKLAHLGWNKRPFFSKGANGKPPMFVKTGAELNGLDIWEVPVWKVRSECGQDSLNALLARQPELEAAIAAMKPTKK